MVTPHGGFNPEWSMYSPLVKLFKMPYHYTLGTFFMNTVVDSVRAVSGWEKNELIRRGVQENKIVTISNGIEDEAYHDVDSLASLKSKRLVKSLGTYILQIGRIYPIKNYETTIRSLVHTPKNINYCIVGADEKDLGYRNSLLTLAKSLGVSERVKFVGVIKGIDKYYIIKHATMMVHMAIWESFCNVVHEGLSQGLVCIVANNTALPLLVKDGVNGYCVDTYDHLQLSKKINYVLDNYHDPSIIEMRKHIVP